MNWTNILGSYVAWRGIKKWVWSPFQIKQIVDIHPVVQASLLSAICVGIFTYLPIFLLRSKYSREAIDPVSIGEILVFFGYIPLGLIPAFALLIWFPGAAKRVEERLNYISHSPPLPTLRVVWLWHWGAAIAILLMVSYPFLDGITHDPIIEWFEVAGIWGWIFFVAGLFIVYSVVIVALFQLLHFILWLKKVLSCGIDLNPLDLDGCGGMSFLGTMLGRFAIIVVLLGMNLAYTAILLYYRNHQGQWSSALDSGLFINSLILLTAYVLGVSVFLFFPTFLVHRAMMAERGELLRRHASLVSNQLREQDDNMDKVYLSLVADYFAVKQSYPVMPFTPLYWQILRLLTLVPPVVGLMSGVYTLATRSG